MKAKQITMRAAAAPLPGSLLWICGIDWSLVTGLHLQGTDSSVQHRAMGPITMLRFKSASLLADQAPILVIIAVVLLAE